MKDGISVVVPTLNEEENVISLYKRIDDTLKGAKIPYEIIVIDDNSTDQTMTLSEDASSRFPIKIFPKLGQPGKAFSLLEGFDKANYNSICMIDADLQYPPEAIANMYALLNENNADVVITERQEKKTSPMRKLSSKVFNYVFVKALFGISYDTQSGLKLFKKRVLDDFSLNPSPWSFDLEFLVRALENKRKILSHTIAFDERTGGVTKVKLLSVTYELAKASLSLRWKTSAQELKLGLQNNSNFIRRTFPVILALTATIMLGMSFTTHKASALDLDEFAQPINTLQNTIPVVSVDLPIINQPTSVGPSNNQPMVSSIYQQNNSQGQQQVAGSSTNRPNTNNPANNTSSTNNSGQILSPTRFNQQTVKPGLVNFSSDTSKFASATAKTPHSIYASGYLEAGLSKRARSNITVLSISTLLASTVLFFYSSYGKLTDMSSIFKRYVK